MSKKGGSLFGFNGNDDQDVYDFALDDGKFKYEANDESDDDISFIDSPPRKFDMDKPKPAAKPSAISAESGLSAMEKAKNMLSKYSSKTTTSTAISQKKTVTQKDFDEDDISLGSSLGDSVHMEDSDDERTSVKRKGGIPKRSTITIHEQLSELGSERNIGIKGPVPAKALEDLDTNPHVASSTTHWTSSKSFGQTIDGKAVEEEDRFGFSLNNNRNNNNNNFQADLSQNEVISLSYSQSKTDISEIPDEIEEEGFATNGTDKPSQSSKPSLVVYDEDRYNDDSFEESERASRTQKTVSQNKVLEVAVEEEASVEVERPRVFTFEEFAADLNSLPDWSQDAASLPPVTAKESKREGRGGSGVVDEVEEDKYDDETFEPPTSTAASTSTRSGFSDLSKGNPLGSFTGQTDPPPAVPKIITPGKKPVMMTIVTALDDALASPSAPSETPSHRSAVATLTSSAPSSKLQQQNPSPNLSTATAAPESRAAIAVPLQSQLQSHQQPVTQTQSSGPRAPNITVDTSSPVDPGFLPHLSTSPRSQAPGQPPSMTLSNGHPPLYPTSQNQNQQQYQYPPIQAPGINPHPLSDPYRPPVSGQSPYYPSFSQSSLPPYPPQPQYDPTLPAPPFPSQYQQQPTGPPYPHPHSQPLSPYPQGGPYAPPPYSYPYPPYPSYSYPPPPQPYPPYHPNLSPPYWPSQAPVMPGFNPFGSSMPLSGGMSGSFGLGAFNQTSSGLGLGPGGGLGGSMGLGFGSTTTSPLSDPLVVELLKELRLARKDAQVSNQKVAELLEEFHKNQSGVPQHHRHDHDNNNSRSRRSSPSKSTSRHNSPRKQSFGANGNANGTTGGGHGLKVYTNDEEESYGPDHHHDNGDEDEEEVYEDEEEVYEDDFDQSQSMPHAISPKKRDNYRNKLHTDNPHGNGESASPEDTGHLSAIAATTPIAGSSKGSLRYHPGAHLSSLEALLNKRLVAEGAAGGGGSELDEVVGDDSYLSLDPLAGTLLASQALFRRQLSSLRRRLAITNRSAELTSAFLMADGIGVGGKSDRNQQNYLS